MTSAHEPAIRVADLDAHRGSKQVLFGVNLEVASGTVVGLLGPNGCGKSTLLAVLAGLVPAAAGEVRFFGAPYRAATRGQVGVVFQSPSLDGRLTVAQNLDLHAQSRGMGATARRSAIATRLAQAGLATLSGTRTRALSGGQRRRVDLVRALVDTPPVLLLDEPTTGLDEASFRAIWTLLRSEVTTRTMLVVTHRPDEAEHCDRLVVMNQGRVVIDGTPASLRAMELGERVVLELATPVDDGWWHDQSLGDIVVAAGQGATVEATAKDGAQAAARLSEVLRPFGVRRIEVRAPSLADVFARLTGASLDGATPSQLFPMTADAAAAATEAG